jgi:hypothetical protein
MALIFGYKIPLHLISLPQNPPQSRVLTLIGRIRFSKIFFDQVAKNEAATAAANQEVLLSVDQGFDEEEEEDGAGGRTLRSPVLLLRRRRRQRVRPRPRCCPLLRRHMVPALRGSLAVH